MKFFFSFSALTSFTNSEKLVGFLVIWEETLSSNMVSWWRKSRTQTRSRNTRKLLRNFLFTYSGWARLQILLHPTFHYVLYRNAYLHLSANPECFVRLRKRFVSSYSVMCVAHWLLGIGDRHTTNFVISTESGRSVGIDFGHAFGSASEVSDKFYCHRVLLGEFRWSFRYFRFRKWFRSAWPGRFPDYFHHTMWSKGKWGRSWFDV